MAIKQLGSALAESAGGAFAAEEDVEFAGQAVPFSLKLIESLILEQPQNTDLLTAAAAGFTRYAYVWVQQPADFIEDEDFAAAQHDRDRARAFYLRAHGYAMRGLDAAHPGLAAQLAADAEAALKSTTVEDVPLLYWAAASLGGAISLGKTEPELVARQTQFAALLERAYTLDPDWDNGSVRELMMAYELARPGGGAEAIERARRQFDRVVEMTNGLRAAPFVSFAESASVQQQNRRQFIELLERALAIDPDKTPASRLANVAAQQRARWLLERVDELFLE
ncbi:MAG: TRAP transporter TatT component family protein [Opitutaceae bacterium]